MLRSLLGKKSLAVVAIAAALAPAACTSSSSNTGSLDPPHLRIESISTTGSSPWTRDGSQQCVQVGDDPMHTLAVNVGPNDGTGHLVSPSSPPVAWTLSPPLACAATPPCGFLQLTVDACTSSDPNSCSNDPATHVALIDSAGPSISVPMKDASVGFYRFHVDLYNPDATPAKDSNGKAYPTEVVVEVTTPCGTPSPSPPPDAGPPRDAGHDAVAPDTGIPVHVDASLDGARSPDTGAPQVDSGIRPDASPVSDGSRPPQHDAATPTDAGPKPPEAGRD